MWKDEWQAWLVARDQSWSEMLSFLYYEGHGSLWYIYIKIWTYLTPILPDPLLITLAHSTLYIGFLYVLWRRFRAPLLATLLFSLGYFVFYEYGVVQRGYVWIMLLLVLLTEKLEKSDYGFVTGILFLLLCQTEVYACIVAIALLFYKYLDHEGTLVDRLKMLKIPVVSTLIGLGLFVLTVFPRAGVAAKQAGVYQLEDQRIVDLPLLALDHLAQCFSTTVLLIDSITIQRIAGILVAGILYMILRRSRAAVLAAGSYLITVTLFSWMIYEGGLRQWGSDYLFVMALIYLIYKQKPGLTTIQTYLVGGLLALQLIYTCLAVYKDIDRPFSHAQATGEFIATQVPKDAVIVGINPMEMAPVIGYSSRSLAGLPSGDSYTYFRWLEQIYIPPPSELELYRQFRQVEGLFVLSDRPLPLEVYKNLSLWKSWSGGSMKSENYYLYSLSAKD